jgi:hypothetical protein
MELISKHTFRLTSGRLVRAYNHLLSVNGDGLLYDGYDHVIWWATERTEEQAQEPLTPAERQDMAAYMIAQWQTWALQGETTP